MWKAEQLGNGGGTGLVDRGSDSHLHSFQIQMASLLPVREDSLKLVF
jgi:hypothetical protein